MTGTYNKFEDLTKSMHHMSDDLAGKTLLLLAGADPHRKVVEAAHELGVRVVVADYLPDEDAPGKQIADESWLVNVFDVDQLVEKCLEEKVDGVLNFCLDAPQKPYQEICERLGLPCYGTREQFAVLSDKTLFKEYCELHNLLTIPSYTEDDVKRGDVEYPLFIKPSDSRGSRGQTICHKPSEIAEAIRFARETSRDNRVIIEKYLGYMQDFTVSCIIIDGNVYPIKLGDRYDGSKADGLDRQHICTLSPSVQINAVLEKTLPRIDRFIADLGIKFGALFIQGFIEDGEVYCYDPGLRLPGSDFDLVTRDITCFDPMKSAINFALTGDVKSCFGDPRGAYWLNGGVGVILSIPARPGTIALIEGIDAIVADPRVHGVSIRHKAGDSIELTGDTHQRIVEFVAYLQDRSELENLLKFIYDNIVVLDSNGNSMVVSRASYVNNVLIVE